MDIGSLRLDENSPDVSLQLEAVTAIIAGELLEFGLDADGGSSGHAIRTFYPVLSGSKSGMFHARSVLWVHRNRIKAEIQTREGPRELEVDEHLAAAIARCYQQDVEGCIDFSNDWAPVVERVYRETGVHLLTNRDLYLSSDGFLCRGREGREPFYLTGLFSSAAVVSYIKRHGLRSRRRQECRPVISRTRLWAPRMVYLLGSLPEDMTHPDMVDGWDYGAVRQDVALARSGIDSLKEKMNSVLKDQV